jgi:hypothetical protein
MNATGNVLRLPVGRFATAAVNASITPWDIDDWGRDDRLARMASRLVSLRWSIDIGGAARLPTESAGLIVVNARQFMLTPWFTALALSRELRRPVRFVGRPDTAPIGALARRLGGLLARPDEVAGALRDGQLLVFGAEGVFDPRGVGEVDHTVVGAAVRTASPVYPATVSVSPIGRSARLDVGDAVRPPRRRRGPFAELELADRLREVLRDQLDAGGPPRTGTPLDWIPLSLSGGQ